MKILNKNSKYYIICIIYYIFYNKYKIGSNLGPLYTKKLNTLLILCEGGNLVVKASMWEPRGSRIKPFGPCPWLSLAW